VLAGLVADGETIVQGAYQIERGYSGFLAKMACLGADCEALVEEEGAAAPED
jgi:UDP-N-acetylglucosamine enolpyruvyl transferase